MTAVAIQMDLAVPAAAFAETDMNAANAILASWGHYLGASRRPFGQQAWRLDINGEPVSVAVSASTVSKTVEGYQRSEVVELARLCTRPGNRWATRVMLRLWREIGALEWPYWQVKAAVAYSDNARHTGDIYRFDGWRRATDKAGSSGGGTWTNKRADGDPAKGPKSLWVWEYGGGS